MFHGPGPGRPKGSKNAATIERERALDNYRDRVAKRTQWLLDKQMSLADGCQFLYVIKKDEKGKKQKAELVKDEETIRAFVDSGFVNGEIDGHGDEYYFVTTERPDNAAIVAMQDRTYGKPQQAIDHTTKGESLNEQITKLDDDQLDQLIASVAAGKPVAPDAPAEGGAGGPVPGEAAETTGEPA